jgi:glycosyltransferase involved in cell wall biosynthesis
LQARRLTIVQYAGDFREAAERLADDGAETYRGQRYTVGYIESLAARLESVTTVTAYTEESYDVVLPSGARAIGAGFGSSMETRLDGRALLRLVERTRPDVLVLRFPFWSGFLWAIRRRVPTLVLLADSFDRHSLKDRVRQRGLGLLLRPRTFEWVANHGRRAAQQLVAAGIPAEKVLAWDFPALDTPEARTVKSHASAEPRVVYVGAMVESKGVDDLLEAVSCLARQGRRVSVELIGALDDGRLARRIGELGLVDVVDPAGLVANDQVIERMRAADAVVVPSRHEYPEGLPLTIYEALCSRTPLVVSDHPMFLGNVVHEESALVFRASDPSDLAAQLVRLLDDAALYRQLSEGGLGAWQRIQIPLKWAALLDDWLERSPESRARLKMQSLGA